MGTMTSVNDEWMELYNNTDSPVNLSGWVLIAEDGTPKINLTGIIPVNGFYLLERTDDTTVPNIPADQIYTGALGNTGEILDLYDNLGNLIDRADNSSGWLAGDNTTKQTMERAGHQTWQTSQNPSGTPKEKNSATEIEIQPEIKVAEPEPLKVASTVAETVKVPVVVEPQQPIIYPSNIIINEIMPSPEGADETEEWIEIFNQNNFEADLSGWQIKDTVGKTSTYVFPSGTKIPAKEFLTLNRQKTKIILNNDGDGLNLIRPDGEVVNSASYEKAILGQSYGLIKSDWIWSENPTPGAVNIMPALAKTAIEVKKDDTGLAAISEPIAVEQDKGNFYPLFAAPALAILSGFVILFLKKKIKI
jgi:hypothetical protein